MRVKTPYGALSKHCVTDWHVEFERGLDTDHLHWAKSSGGWGQGSNGAHSCDETEPAAERLSLNQVLFGEMTIPVRRDARKRRVEKRKAGPDGSPQRCGGRSTGRTSKLRGTAKERWTVHPRAIGHHGDNKKTCDSCFEIVTISDGCTYFLMLD